MQASELKRLGEAIEDRSQVLALGLSDAAAQRGLLDVGYGFADSPFGRLLVAMTRRGLVTLVYPEESPEDALERIAARVSPRVLESVRATDQIRRELDEYFEQRRRTFSVPVDLRLTRGFNQKVLEQTARIPYGSVSTYREVSARAGSPQGMRAAGQALASNPVPIMVPCHRVVRTGGALGGYAGGTDRKAALLELEGALQAGEERWLGRTSGRAVRRRWS